MKKQASAVLAIFSLLFSTLLVATPAASVDTVTKTITVKKSDNSVYPGAYVSLLGWDNNSQVNTATTPVITNSSGVAVITVSSTADFYGYGVQTPVGDFSHASFVEFGIQTGMSETFTAVLKPANTKVIVKARDGTVATPGSWIHYPATGDYAEIRSAKPIIRSGAFGIDLSTSISTTGKFRIGIEPNNMSGNYWTEYGLSRAVVDGNSVFTLYTDASNTTIKSPSTIDGQSVYELSFLGPNFAGSIKTSSGGAFTVPAGVKGQVVLFKASEAGDGPSSEWITNAKINSNGSFELRLNNVAAGKYYPIVQFSGSHSIPTFLGAPIWVNSSGQYSTSQSGSYVSYPTFQYATNLPTGTFLKIKVVDPNTNLAIPSRLWLDQYQFNGPWWGPSDDLANGLGSYSLPDGTYMLDVQGLSNLYIGRGFELTVDQGNFSISERGTGTDFLADANGVFNLPVAIPNVKFKIVNPSDATDTLTGNIDVFDDSIEGDNFVTNSWSGSNGIASMMVPNGTYRAVVQSYDGVFASKDYTLVVNGSSVTVTDNLTDATVTAVDGIFTVSPALPNVTGRILDSAGEVVRQTNGVYFNVNLQSYQDNNWRYIGHAQVAPDGSFGFKVDAAGDYRIRIEPSGRADVATTYKEFTLAEASSSLALGDVLLDPSNFIFKVVAPGETNALRNAQLMVRKQLSTDPVSYEEPEHYSTQGAGVAGIKFTEPGTFLMTAQSPWDFSSALGANKSYIATVSGEAPNLSVSIESLGGDAVTAVDGVFALSLAVPNVTATIRDSAGNAIDLREGWVDISLQRQSGENWDWYQHVQLPDDGAIGFLLEETGNYRLRFQPQGIENSGVTYTEVFEITEGNKDSFSRHFGFLNLSAPTAKFSVREPGSSTNLPYSSIEIRKDGRWYDWINSGSNGLASFTATTAGEYDFIAHPSESAGSNFVRKTYSGTVALVDDELVLTMDSVTQDANGVYALSLGQPNITGQIADSSGAAIRLPRGVWIHIQVQKFNAEQDQWQWIDNWSNVRSDGTFGLNINEAGTYRLRLEPSGSQSYSLTNTSSFTITNSNAMTYSKNFGLVRLKAPSLVGEVLAPTGTDTIPYSQVVAIDSETGQEMWEYSRQSDHLGKWAMSLPEGSYALYAKAPWGSVNYGSGPLISGVVVDADGQATVNGTTVTNLQLRLSPATWSGTVVNPETLDPMQDVSVCFWHQEGTKFSSDCTNSNQSGQWALSKPAGFTGFNDSSVLSVRSWRSNEFAENRYQGEVEIEEVLGVYAAGNTYQNRTLSPAIPNSRILVMAGDSPAANVWVNVSRQNEGWVGGGQTDDNGYARLNVSGLPFDLSIQTYVNNGSGLSDNFTNTTVDFTSAEVQSQTSGGIFSATIDLKTPNFRAKVYKPGVNASTPGDVAGRAWVEIFNESTYTWINGSDSNALGVVSLNLEAPESGTHRYRITVNPPYPNSDLLSRRTYYADVNDAGEISVFNSAEQAITAVEGLFPLVLASASVKGIVTGADGQTPIRDSWVVPIDISERYELWQYGAGSNQVGKFGIALPDGSYYLVANVPWNTSGVAKSERCRIDIADGVITTGNSNCVSDGEVTLKLRTPNLTMRLVHEGQPVAFSHVGIAIGNWYTNANSGKDGIISLFIDADEIAASNPGMTGSQQIRVWVDPPGTSQGIVRWECVSGDAKPLCEDLPNLTIGQEFNNGANLSLGDVSFQTPNTTFTVLKPGTPNVEVSDGWVTLFKQEEGWNRWIGHSNVNSSGLAQFNLDDSLISDPDALFTVEVNPGWKYRTTNSRRVYSNLTYDEVNSGSFLLGTPNLKLKIKQALSTSASKWAWIMVEKLQGANYQWDSGYGTDEFGYVAVTLDASSSYRITAHPGPGSTGARSVCLVTVTEESVVQKVAGECVTGTEIDATSKEMELGLSAGNLQGRVLQPGGVATVQGAIVFAEAFEVETNVSAGIFMEAVTNRNGQYGLQLDTAYDWKVKVFYVNPPGTAVPLASMLTPVTFSSAELLSGATHEFELTAR